MEQEVESQEISREEVNPYIPVPPYPFRIQDVRLYRSLALFNDTLKKLHVNMPFLEVLSQIPKYAKFFKNLLVKNRN